MCALFSRKKAAVRGDSHEIGNPHNGNYLGTMEFLAKFDTFLADHIARYGYRGRGSPFYLSRFIMEEVISLIASEVKTNILSSILNTKHYSIIADLTPDISHIDQLTLVARYIENSKPVERYVGFVSIKSHKKRVTGRDDSFINFSSRIGHQYVLFFGIVAEIYRFFCRVTISLEIMKGKLSKKGLVVKKLSDTRYSARHDAIKAIIS